MCGSKLTASAVARIRTAAENAEECEQGARSADDPDQSRSTPLGRPRSMKPNK
ncbi:hypothetical protein APR09_001105 [Nocardia amikacinitolerans]|nr:hypothetical protein [Nocardia amikacinitolerans]